MGLLRENDQLFGRVTDIEYLIDRVKKPGLTFISGRPKMGKSWLIKVLCDKLTDEGMVVDHENFEHNIPLTVTRIGKDSYIPAKRNRYLPAGMEIDFPKRSKCVKKGSLSGHGMAPQSVRSGKILTWVHLRSRCPRSSRC